MVDSDHKESHTEQGYQVIARRFRPQSLDELVGQNHIAQALANAIEKQRIGPVYLFTGARGVGKTSTARIFAKSLNCVNGPTAIPCNVCDSCEHIALGDDVDAIEIDGASNRGIDEIRQLRQNASIRPARSRFKIYIIDEVHMLTREAFNALLKTLEEPPPHVKFIFCTTEANKIPITILSRCQRFDFAGIESGAISVKLAQIAAVENVTADSGVFETLARRASGSMRDAQSLLEQLLSFAPQHIRIADVHEMLGTADDQRIFRILDAIIAEDTTKIFEELDAAASEGVDYGILIEQLIGVFRDIMVVTGGGEVKLLLYSEPGRFEQIRDVAKQLGIQRVLASMQILDHSHNRMRFSAHARTLLELALVRISHLGQMQTLAVLLDQMKSGHSLPKSLPQPAPQTIRGVSRTVSQPPDVAPIATPVAGVVEPKKRSIDLDKLDDATATEVWREAVKELPMLLASNASEFHAVRFSKPNVFQVFFESPAGSGNSVSKSFCEKNLQSIAAALEKNVGQPVQISLELFEVQPKEKPVPKNIPKNDPRAKAKLMAETADSPMIAKAIELFDAELIDVKPNPG